VSATWLLVALLVIIPASIHHKPSDMYWVPEPVSIVLS
jgi:hypothetical protein